MASEVIGRHDEVERLRAFLRLGAANGPRALVLEGEAGIGKSTLWRAALEEATEGGYRVLSARPAEAERGLAFTGLGDLLEPVRERVLPALPPPRRRPLQAVLLVEDGDVAVDPRALGVAVRSALELLAGDGSPLLVAVDDVQWLDRASAEALLFGLRRVEAPLALLLARRVAEGIASSPLEQALAEAAVGRLRVGPLSAGAIQSLVRAALGRAFPRPTLMRIHEASGGNPFYALELARALPETVDATRPLPVPATLVELVSARLAGLPRETRVALALVAAIGSPTLETLRATGVDEDALEPALAVRVLEQEGRAIAFTHPLFGSVLYQELTWPERRRIHGSLVGVVRDSLERARHLALSTDEPDEGTAATLEEAQAFASARGGWSTAAELGEHARRLTPPGDETAARRRALALARSYLGGGDSPRAAAIGGELLAAAPDGLARAAALVLLSDVRAWAGDLEGLVDLRVQALSEARDDPALCAAIHARLAYAGRIVHGLEWGETHARRAVGLAEQLGDDPLRARALAALAQIRFNRGEPDATALAERARALALETGDADAIERTTEVLGHVLTWSVSLEAARELLECELDTWRARDELRAASACWYLALVEHRAGRLSLAAELAHAARETDLRYERDNPLNLLPIALVAASQGDYERARECALRGIEAGMTRISQLAFVPVLGRLDLWNGDAPSAVACFEEAEQALDDQAFGEPSFRWWREDQVEALLELGRIDDALGLLSDWEAAARHVGRDWVLAQVTRCRGLVAAAGGEVESSASLLADAAAAHERVGDPIGRARALLGLGIVRRRARQKRGARDAIEAAVAIFEECEAKGWAEKARAELGRIGGRAREEGLTAAEQRVAALVAEGRTNREVAATLVLGERTVETHLTHIYAKLGVRSRTELARVYEG